MLWECLFAAGALEYGFCFVGFRGLGDGLALTGPAADREAFEDIVVDLTCSGAGGGCFAELTA